ncbi:MAG: hypothetical protein ACR5LB_08475 [Wolbachia sp.]
MPFVCLVNFLSIKVIPTFVIEGSNKIYNKFAKSLIVGKLFNLPLGFGVTTSAENFIYLAMTMVQLYEHCNYQVICVTDGVIPVRDTGIQPFHNHQRCCILT